MVVTLARGLVPSHRAQNSAYRSLRLLVPSKPSPGSALAVDLLAMAAYLVTGGAGFIGSHLTEELVRRGRRVRVVDSLITGKRRNLEHVPGVEFIEGDLADRQTCARAVEGKIGRAHVLNSSHIQKSRMPSSA